MPIPLRSVSDRSRGQKSDKIHRQLPISCPGQLVLGSVLLESLLFLKTSCPYKADESGVMPRAQHVRGNAASEFQAAGVAEVRRRSFSLTKMCFCSFGPQEWSEWVRTGGFIWSLFQAKPRVRMGCGLGQMLKRPYL